MRKLMFLVLLAGVATPAISVAKPIERSDEAKSEQSNRHQQQQESPQKQQSNDDRGQQSHDRGDRSGGNKYARSSGGEQSPAAVQTKGDNGYGGGGQSNEARHQRFGGYQNNGGYENPAAQQKMNSDNASGSARDWRSRERRPIAQDPKDEQQGVAAQDRRSNGSFRQFDRPPPNVMRSRAPVVSNVPREGTQPPLRTTQNNQRHHTSRWNGNWRNDRRYNWQDRRRHHRSLFRLGLYFDPFGWGYQRYSIGWRLWPNYYGRNYWFNPVQFGLPYAPPGYQWVRYYNDALLVDTWSGQVVDVIYSFFW